MPLSHDEFVSRLTAARRRVYALICTLVVDRSAADGGSERIRSFPAGQWSPASRGQERPPALGCRHKAILS